MFVGMITKLKIHQDLQLSLDTTDVVGTYGAVSVYGNATYGGPSQPIVRKSVEGSGFAVALRVEDGATSTGPYSLKGFQMEFQQLGARR